MAYNFSSVKKQEVRGDAYKGMSINKSGSYITKTLRQDNNLDNYEAVDIQIDVANNAVLLSFKEKYEGQYWKLNKAQEGITIAMKGSNVNIPIGRYGVVQDSGDQVILKFNPQI